MIKAAGSKGSLTVEASISSTLFLCFLLLFLHILKMITIHMTLDHAVSETARQLAAASYPLRYLHEVEDEFMIPGEGGQPVSAESLSSAFTGLLTGSLEADEMDHILATLTDSVKGAVGDQIREALLQMVGDDYFELKRGIEQKAVRLLLEDYCSGSPAAMENCRIVFNQLPQGEAEYSYRSKEPDYLLLCGSMGILPAREDVAIAVEYDWKLPLPFFSTHFTSRHIAVEKAWMYGGNGIYTVKDGTVENPGDEGENTGDNEQEEEQERNKTVYITKTGEKYHEGDCPRNYLQKSRIPISLFDAKRRGYAPCKVCVTKTAKPLKK